MNIGIIPKRYAKALYAYATDEKAEDMVYRCMLSLAACYRTFPNFRALLTNPAIGYPDKLQLLKNAGGKNPCIPYTRFIELILHHKRESLLQSIALTYIDLYRQEKHIVVGSLTTAVPLSKEAENKMKKKLLTDKEDTLEFTTSVDPDILGGFVFDYDTYRFDASVATQLKRVKNQLLEKNKKTV